MGHLASDHLHHQVELGGVFSCLKKYFFWRKRKSTENLFQVLATTMDLCSVHKCRDLIVSLSGQDDLSIHVISALQTLSVERLVRPTFVSHRATVYFGGSLCILLQE